MHQLQSKLSAKLCQRSSNSLVNILLLDFPALKKNSYQKDAHMKREKSAETKLRYIGKGLLT